MKTVNEQLNLPLVDGGAVVYQPSQYGKGTEYERGYNYPVLASTLGAPVYSNSTGWSGCNSCGSYSGADGWSNAYGVSYPALIYPAICTGTYKQQCQECKTECKDTKNLKWKEGGRSCFISCFEGKVRTVQSIASQTGVSSIIQTPTEQKSSDNTGTGTNTNETKTGMSTGAKIGIAVGAVAVIGAIVYFGFIRKK